MLRTFRALVVLALLMTGIAFGASCPEEAYLASATRVHVPQADVRSAGRRIMDVMVSTYGSADMSGLADAAKAPWSSPNLVVPMISLGQGYLNRFEVSGSFADFGRAVVFFEQSLESYPSWGESQASSPTLAYLLLGVYRLKVAGIADESILARVDALFSAVEAVAEKQADNRLTDDYPFHPYISGTPQDGDTQAESNAWEASFMAWAANMFSGHPHAALWEAKARELAKFSIVRDADNMFFKGERIRTVEDDYTLWNHWVEGNPYYSVGTVMLLRQGALAYKMAGNPIPAEFAFNTQGLYAKYKTYCVKNEKGKWAWNRASDPEGDPTIFPLAGIGDDAHEASIVAQKVADGFLWVPTAPVDKLADDLGQKGMTSASAEWTAIQNGKVVWYYLMGSYLWHSVPPVAIPVLR